MKPCVSKKVKKETKSRGWMVGTHRFVVPHPLRLQFKRIDVTMPLCMLLGVLALRVPPAPNITADEADPQALGRRA